MPNPEILTARVGIGGGGPAGLMLSLLDNAGVDSVVVEKRDHETIRTTHRAGILEARQCVHAGRRRGVGPGAGRHVETAAVIANITAHKIPACSACT